MTSAAKSGNDNAPTRSNSAPSWGSHSYCASLSFFLPNTLSPPWYPVAGNSVDAAARGAYQVMAGPRDAIAIASFCVLESLAAGIVSESRYGGRQRDDRGANGDQSTVVPADDESEPIAKVDGAEPGGWPHDQAGQHDH